MSKSKYGNGKQLRSRENGQPSKNETCVDVLLLRRKYEGDVHENQWADDIVGRIVVRANGQRVLHLNPGTVLHWHDFAEGGYELQMMDTWTSGRRFAAPEIFASEKAVPASRISERRSAQSIEAPAGRPKAGYAARQSQPERSRSA